MLGTTTTTITPATPAQQDGITRRWAYAEMGGWHDVCPEEYGAVASAAFCDDVSGAEASAAFDLLVWLDDNAEDCQ